MKKTLLFISDRTQYFFPVITHPNIKVVEVWKRGIREKYGFLIKVCRKLRIPVGFFFEAWTEEISEYSQIIIFDGCYDKLLMYYLDKKNPKAQKNVFCWNPKKRLGHVWGTPYRLFSFDPVDAKTCNMEFLPTFYSEEVVLPERELKYDVIFLANIKDRANEIEGVYDCLKKKGFELCFYLLGDAKELHSIDVQSERLAYEKYLELIAQGRAILDINSPGQTGLSLRAMEALFFGKKLITTNRGIMEYDFYHQDNIFVWGVDSADNLQRFINTPMHPVADEIVKQYSVQSWIEKFHSV